MSVVMLELIYGVGLGLEWVPEEDAYILDFFVFRIVWLYNVGD